jgi:hypothetical protein
VSNVKEVEPDEIDFCSLYVPMVPGEHAGLLYGVSSTDPATMAAACAAIAALSLVAGLVPAHRASRVDPAVALRHE